MCPGRDLTVTGADTSKQLETRDTIIRLRQGSFETPRNTYDTLMPPFDLLSHHATGDGTGLRWHAPASSD
jgi:hypothetical protein